MGDPCEDKVLELRGREQETGMHAWPRLWPLIHTLDHTQICSDAKHVNFKIPFLSSSAIILMGCFFVFFWRGYIEIPVRGVLCIYLFPRPV